MLSAVDDSVRQIDDLFAAQFTEQDGFIVYQRGSFVLPWAGRGRAYIVTADERRRFIAAFESRSGEIVRRMIRDIFLAFLSFGLLSQLLHTVLGQYASDVELALLLAHLVTIVVVENRRMKEIWDAPLVALAGRAPAPDFMQKGIRWLRPMSANRDRALIIGASLGAFCATTWVLTLGERPTPEAKGFESYGAQALSGLIVVVGALCLIELVRRAFRGETGT